MRRILWWMGKEAREQRVALVLLLVGLVVGSWWWAWSGRGQPTDVGPLAEPYAAGSTVPHRYSLEGDWHMQLTISLVVVLLVLGAGLFAADQRRGC